MKKIIFTLLTLLFAFGITGCSLNSEGGTDMAGSSDSSLQKAGAYVKITAQEAKKVMEEQSEAIILDVRTKEEYDTGHIKNSILIPDTEIAARAQDELPDKSQTILVYCRSGRRSKGAAEQLLKLGYTDVRDFGGIIDWPYDTVV